MKVNERVFNHASQNILYFNNNEKTSESMSPFSDAWPSVPYNT